ncbi:sensor histidine kinase [uncultured Oxalicibacterium sp.]|uniref:sensor histidine kinase n=1 Tax=uncultured Oxalicibacterium sp. TaxID=1168540 RepID=UPI0025EFC58B|nr:sensor histidine kinase [uncultured Oxalicibacterium sp.]
MTAHAEPLKLDQGSNHFDAAGHLSLLRDSASTLSVEDAADAAGWKALAAGVNVGFTSDVIWLKLTITADIHPHGGWILRFSNALLDDVKVYIGKDGGPWTLLGASGEDVTRSAWPFEYRSAAFQFPEFTGTEVVLMRLKTKNALATQVEVWPRLAFDNATRRETLFYGLYFGFYLLLIALHVVFWSATRASMSGLFLAYMGTGVFNEAFSLGLLQQITHISVGWSDRLLGCGIALSIFSAVFVAFRQLELARLYPRFVRFTILSSGVLIALSLLLVLLGYYGSGMQIAQPLALLLSMGFFLLSGYLCWRGWRPARFFLLVFGPFYASIFIVFLRNLGMLPVNWFTENVATFCGMLHMLLLSLYIIGRHERQRREKERRQANFAANLARQHSLQLEREVKSRTAELREEIRRRELLEGELRSSLELERKVRDEQRDFVAMVSHEFRTPLAIIGTSAQQLGRNLSASVEKNLARCNNIREAAMRLLGLVDEYLSEDRMREVSSVVRSTDCDIHVLLSGLIQEFPADRIVCVSANVPGELVSDASLLRIAMRNLLSNADRYAPQDDVIRINVSEEGESLCLDVVNVGEYIAPAEQERLFQKYYRGQNTQHRPGAGLGLYLVRRIAEQLGGRVTLTSAGGDEAVCFRFCIPRGTPTSVIS